jgi:glucosamine--fructose-6-phosphate aminotransferase (isomerizing)
MMSVQELARFEHVQDILAQPEAVERTVAALQNARPPEPFPADLASGRFRRLVLTGMGASFHALYPLHLSLTAHGAPSLVVETSELIHYQTRLLSPDSLVIAVSQSGRSAEILRLIEAAAGKLPLIAVSNSSDSPLAKNSAFAVLTQAGRESSVSTKTYVATLAALEWLGAALCGLEPGPKLAAVAGALPAMREYLARWADHVQFLVDWLAPVRHIFLAGRGASLASACEGGLVLKEAAHFPAEGMGCAEFRHGPLDMAGEGILVCVFAGEPRTAALNRRLAQDVEAAGGMSAWIGPDSAPAPFRIPEVSPEARPLLEILPVQMISLALSARAGREPGRFARLGKVTAEE